MHSVNGSADQCPKKPPRKPRERYNDMWIISLLVLAAAERKFVCFHIADLLSALNWTWVRNSDQTSRRMVGLEANGYMERNDVGESEKENDAYLWVPLRDCEVLVRE